MSIAENLREVRQEIEAAAKACGRDPEEVKLVAVSKTFPAADAKEAVEVGQIDLGENKVQELRDKQPEVPGARWHMIGNLQRNKVKYIAEWVYLIHSVDSEKLLKEINKQAAKYNRVINCLLQVNISDEPQKGGFEPDEVAGVLEKMEAYPNVRVMGLMGMAEFTDDEAVIRRQFRSLRDLRDQLRSFENDRVQLSELSMGMSGDFQIAVEEGSTMVRIGSAIFGKRDYT